MAPYFIILPPPVNLYNTLYQTSFIHNTSYDGKATGTVLDNFLGQENKLILFKISKKNAFALKKKFQNGDELPVRRDL